MTDGAEPTALPSREDFDPETGEIESNGAGGDAEVDEDTARDLDRQSFAEMEGRSDEEHGDQHDGADDEVKANALIERIEAATIVGDVIAVEKEAEAADLAPDQAKRVSDAAKAARATLTAK